MDDIACGEQEERFRPRRKLEEWAPVAIGKSGSGAAVVGVFLRPVFVFSECECVWAGGRREGPGCLRSGPVWAFIFTCN
jgi:hypothetical protein